MSKLKPTKLAFGTQSVKFVMRQYIVLTIIKRHGRCLSAKVYVRSRPCINTRASELRAPEIIRSQ